MEPFVASEASPRQTHRNMSRAKLSIFVARATSETSETFRITIRGTHIAHSYPLRDRFITRATGTSSRFPSKTLPVSTRKCTLSPIDISSYSCHGIARHLRSFSPAWRRITALRHRSRETPRVTPDVKSVGFYIGRWSFSLEVCQRINETLWKCVNTNKNNCPKIRKSKQKIL